mgnify:CR=1 FL=1
MKNEKGMTYIMLLIMIVLIILMIVGVFYFLQKKYIEGEIENVKTDMLLIQGNIKLLSEKNVAKKEDATLQGRKVSENKDDEKVKQLLQKGIIEEQEENFAEYYILEEQQLRDMGLDTVNLKEGNYFIVNYKTDEVITTNPIRVDKNEYYKLSELKLLQDEKNNQINKDEIQNVEENKEE